MKKNALFLYLSICFLISWALMFSLMLLPQGLQSVGMSLVGMISMMVPFLTVLLVKKAILKEKTGIQWQLRLKGHVKVYLMAMYLPVLLTLLSALLYFLAFPSQLDLSIQSYVEMVPPAVRKCCGRHFLRRFPWQRCWDGWSMFR